MKKIISCLALGMLSMLFLAPIVHADDHSITSSGIGKVKTGGSISKLPKQITGVYDKLELVSDDFVDEGAYEERVTIYRASLNGEPVFEFYPEGDKIGSLSIYSKNLKTKKGLNLNSTPADLFAAGGKVISFNDGGEAIVCDGVLFKGLPMTQQGYKKSEQAYLGAEVSFDVTDFEANGHPTEILVSEYYANMAGESAPSGNVNGNSSSGKNVLSTILGVLFIIAVLAMIAHMVYVNYFAPGYPENPVPTKGTPENNSFVKSSMDALYNVDFTPYCDPNETPGPDVYNFPIGKKAAYHAKEVLDDVYANHLPVDGEAAEELRKVSIVTNESFKRTFAGSKLFLIITIVVAAGACYLNKDATALLYFIPSCIMYYLSCRTPNYILMEKDLKAMKTGKASNGIMNGVLAGIFGLAATAPVYVEVTKNRNTGEVIDTTEDHSMTWIAMAISLILFIVLAYAMVFVGILNYLRNYVLRK